MRRGCVALALALASLVPITCGEPPAAPHNASSRLACVDPNAPHHAYVVVEHLSGAWIERCVGFGPEIIGGQTIMDRSGIAYIAQGGGPSTVMCRLDLEPLAPNPDGACAPSANSYWAAFVESQGRWSIVRGTFTQVQLRDNEALGWRYVRLDQRSPSPPPSPHRL